MGDPLSYLLMSLYGNTQSNFCGFPSIHLPPLIWVQVWVVRVAVSAGNPRHYSPRPALRPAGRYNLSSTSCPPFFRPRTMAPDLEVLILIPAGSRSASNRQSASCRSMLDEANRGRGVCKKAATESRGHPTWPPSDTRLLLQILSIEITIRIGDKGQPWWSPTPTGNESDFLPAAWTVFFCCLVYQKSHVIAEDFSFSVS